MFIFLREVGHAMIDVLDLPIVGQEEDAADQLATVFFSQEPVLATWAANFWGEGRGGGPACRLSTLLIEKTGHPE